MEEPLRIGLAHRRSMSASALYTGGESPMARTASSSQLSSPMLRARPNAYMALITETEIAPSPVYSERELTDVMAAIQTDLGNADDWSARLAALERLQAISCGGAGSFEVFLPLLRGMQELVAEQIADLRSILCKAACRTASVLAQQLKEAFAPFAELWTPVMLKLVFSSTAVMASAADHAIRIIVSSSRSGYPRLLSIFMETFNSKKNGVLRARCVEYVMQAVAQWEILGSDRHVADIGEFILKAAKDADAGTRAAARHCFWVLHDRQPTVADRILNKMDSNIQKHVHLERANVQATVFAESFANGGDAEPATQHPISNHTRPSLRHGASERLIRDRPALAQQQSLPVAEATSSVSQARRISLAGPSRVMANPRERPATNSNSDYEPPLPSTRQLLSASRVSMHDAPRAERESIAPRQPGLANGARRVMLPKPPVATTGPAGLTGPLASAAQRTSVAVAEEPAVSERPIRSIREDLLRRPERVAVPREIAPAFRITDQQVQEIMTLSQNPHWKKRVEALRLVKANLERLQDLAADATPSNMEAVGKLADVVIAQLSEPNLSISQAAFAALELAVGGFAKQLEPRIANAVPKLLLRLNESALRSREHVKNLLDQIQKTFDADVLATNLIVRLTEIPEKAKVSLCEFLQVTLSTSHEYLQNAPNVRTMLVRLTTCILSNSRPSASLVKAVHRLLHLVHETSPDLFLSQLAALSMEQQAIVKPLIEPATELRSVTTTVSTQSGFKTSAALSTASAFSPASPMSSFASSPNENTMTNNEQVMAQQATGTVDLDGHHLDDFERMTAHATTVVKEPQHFTPREQKRIPLSQLQHLNTDSPSPAFAPNGMLFLSPEPEACHPQGVLLRSPPSGSSPRDLFAAVDRWLNPNSDHLNFRKGSNLVVKLAKSQDEQLAAFWEDSISRVTDMLLAHLEACANSRGTPNIEAMANYHSILKAVEGVIIYRHAYVASFAEDFVLRLLRCHPIEASIGSHALHIVFLLGQRDTSHVLQILMSNLATTQAAALRLPIFLSLEKVLPIAAANEVHSILPTLAPTLQASFADASKAVRKATVNCFAVLNDLHADRMTPYMLHLAPEQQKLVEIMTERWQARKSAEASSTAY